MHEKPSQYPVNGSDNKQRRIPPFVRILTTFSIMVVRLAVCPGDDVLAIAASAATGFRTSDTPREAVLPDPIKIIFEDEKEDRDRNKEL